MSNGLFTAVTGIRRIGDLGRTASTSTAGPNSSSSSNALRKRTFSEVGKLSSTVAAQQFVFMGGNSNVGVGDESSRLGDNSSSGFGLSRSVSMSNAPGGAVARSKSSTSAPAPAAGSLFAQLGAKRGSSLKSAKSISSH